MILKVVITAAFLVVGTSGRPKKEDAAAAPPTCHNEEANACMSKACIEASNRLYQYMDTSADPCEDFNQFACGGFLANSVIPDNEDELSTSFTPAKEQIYIKGRILLEAEPSEEDFVSDQNARNFYKACMNQEKIEELGLEPAHLLLNKLGGWPVLEGDKWSEKGFEWYTYTVKKMELGLSILEIMGPTVGPDTRNNSNKALYLDEASLGVPREYLIKGFDDKDVQHYYTYMVESAKLMGAKEATAKEAMKKALEFELKLANISTPQNLMLNPQDQFNNTTVGKFENLPGFPACLKDYLNDLFRASGITEFQIEGDQKIIINPNYLRKVSKVLVETDKRVIADYLGWRVFMSVIGNLNKAARELGPKDTSTEPDWKRCVKSVGFNTDASVVLGLAGSMYVRGYFKPEEKKEMNQMVKYIRGGLKTMLDEVQWIDNGTKAEAQKKLKLMKQYIAYPDELLEKDTIDEYYANFKASPDSYLENVLNLDKFEITKNFKQLKEKVDPEHWTEHNEVALVGAFNIAASNSMEVPAGILQGAFFNAKAPKYMNYGAIGAVIGHEITHGFDDKGRTYDFEGKLVDWWANETAIEYKRRAQCLIEQYGNFTAEQINTNLNGTNTIGENIADNGGIKEAYLGYQNYVKDHGDEPQLPGHDYTARQMFWISYGQVWCIKYKDGELKSMISTDEHSPGEFRIKGPLSNNPDFAKDFKCKVGSRMNPAKKCTVW